MYILLLPKGSNAMKIKCLMSIMQIFQKKQAHLTCFERWMNTINFDLFYIYLLT